MARKRNSLIGWCITSTVLTFFTIMRILPLSVARAIGRGGATLAYYAVPRVRKTGMANLDLAYGDSLSQKEKKAILKESMINLGIIGAEMPHNTLLYSEDRAKYCRILGEEHLEKHGTGVAPQTKTTGTP